VLDVLRFVTMMVLRRREPSHPSSQESIAIASALPPTSRDRPYRHICATWNAGMGRPYCRICATWAQAPAELRRAPPDHPICCDIAHSEECA
jgi:hypothetical protein